MAAPDKHSRTERPTGKRVAKAKRKGNVPRSADFTSAFMIIIGMVTLYVSGGYMMAVLKGAGARWWREAGTIHLTEGNAYHLLLDGALVIGMALLPLFGILIVSGLLINHVQEPISVSWERITFSLDKINPVNGFQRFFSKDSLVEGVKATVKILILGYVSYRTLRDETAGLIYLVEGDIPSIMSYLSHLLFRLVLNCAGTLLLISFLDLLYVKWRFLENLKMTKVEVKEELKQMEGDPKIKGKIRQAQFAAARRRMRVIIPTADVVVTNPTHYAVALRYDRERMAAPVVLVKGVDHMALQIRQLAREFGVTLVENRPLARELYDEVDEGEEIPEKLYTAVAEVLAYVYGLKGKKG